MSMNEFKRQENFGDEEPLPFPIEGCSTPEDFTSEDLAFASELSKLFSLEEEDLPPCYLQTLLNAEGQRLQQVEPGFEQRMSAHVFRRLELPRYLFPHRHSLVHMIRIRIHERLARRSVLGGFVTFALIMLLTIAFTAGSFASGIAVLLRGVNVGGIYMAESYPSLNEIHKDVPTTSNSSNEISLFAAKQQLYFPIYWPKYMPSPYSLKNINLYSSLDQQWANGPMLELEYSLPPSAVASKGTGEIWVREFEPRANVLQVVKKGASVPIDVDNSDRALAIYVDGQWVPHGRDTPQWVLGERSELIYQINGVVFWIVGDQRDGVGEQQLMQIAQGLNSHPLNRQFPLRQIPSVRQPFTVTELTEDVPGPFSYDVIVLLPANSSQGPYYISVSSYQPPKSSH